MLWGKKCGYSLDAESFVEITDEIYEKGSFQGEKRNQRRQSIDGHEEQDADNPSGKNRQVSMLPVRTYEPGARCLPL